MLAINSESPKRSQAPSMRGPRRTGSANTASKSNSAASPAASPFIAAGVSSHSPRAISQRLTPSTPRATVPPRGSSMNGRGSPYIGTSPRNSTTWRARPPRLR